MPTKSAARTITRNPNTLRLARVFKTTPQVWMHLQADWDLHEAMRKRSAASVLEQGGSPEGRA